MKKILIKILLLVLTLSTLISCISCLSGCKDNQNSTSNSPDADLPNDNEGNNNNDVLSYLPDKKFNANFTILCMEGNTEFFRENESGNSLDKAIYLRNKAIENRFGVKIIKKEASGYDFTDVIWGAYQSSKYDEFDLISSQIYTAGNLALGGVLKNLYELEYLNFSNSWWNQEANAAFSTNDKAYFAIGDMNTSNITDTMCIYYNKALTSHNGINNLYKTVVTDNDWTADKLINYMTAYEKPDPNVSSKPFAMGGTPYGDALIWAFDTPMFTENSETGKPQYNLGDGKDFSNMVDKFISSLVQTKKIDRIFYGTSHDANGNSFNPVHEDFKEGKLMFICGTIGEAATVFDGTDSLEFGIIPYPKYTSSQKEYKTSVRSSCYVSAVMKTYSEEQLQKIGVVLEAMNCLSSDVTKAVYDELLGKNYKNDQQQKQIVDMILESRIYDFGQAYLGFTSPDEWFKTALTNGNSWGSFQHRYWRQNKDSLNNTIIRAYNLFGITFEGIPEEQP